MIILYMYISSSLSTPLVSCLSRTITQHKPHTWLGSSLAWAVGTMDGLDGAGQRKKPHGNPHPKRGAIKQGIIGDWFGKKDSSGPGNDGGNDDNGSGGGGTDAAGRGGHPENRALVVN
jgi:hypothetical protein